MNLILNLQTGTVSPQFHMQYDNFFETVRDTLATAKENVWCKLADFSTQVMKSEIPLQHKVQEDYISSTTQIGISNDITNVLENTIAIQDLEGDIA